MRDSARKKKVPLVSSYLWPKSITPKSTLFPILAAQVLTQTGHGVCTSFGPPALQAPIRIGLDAETPGKGKPSCWTGAGRPCLLVVGIQPNTPQSHGNEMGQAHEGQA